MSSRARTNLQPPQALTKLIQPPRQLETLQPRLPVPLRRTQVRKPLHNLRALQTAKPLTQHLQVKVVAMHQLSPMILRINKIKPSMMQQQKVKDLVPLQPTQQLLPRRTTINLKPRTHPHNQTQQKLVLQLPAQMMHLNPKKMNLSKLHPKILRRPRTRQLRTKAPMQVPQRAIKSRRLKRNRE